MSSPRIMLILTENETIVDRDDLETLVRWSEQAEALGVDGVMLSDHLTLGPTAGDQGRMSNPRMYALPGNQDPATPWPDSLLLASAIAARTSTLRIFLGAIIAPLRHPVQLAKQLATLDLISQGRLIVQPTVSWHRDEYAHLGVPFEQRGRILDEHLEIWKKLWSQSPASHNSELFQFEDLYMEPKCFTPGGPPLWFGGQRLSEPIARRLVEHGSGFHPLGPPTPEELDEIRTRMRAAGRDFDSLEKVGGIRAVFPDDDSPSSVADGLASIPPQLDAGYTTICVKPNQFIDDADDFEPFIRELVGAFGEWDVQN
jgi:alkanesulfonate monooxygenase SsuD/methylene tetrahydromethanopterin reductase-like flavin-dependent oxidoreductase (luciferase family)